MKKIIFAMAVLFGCAMESNAQTNFIATLQHEGEFTHYYGAGALTEAYNAADTNDIITLSAGTFTSPGIIEKGITIRGTGMETVDKDSTYWAAKPKLTHVTGEIIFSSKNETHVSTIEGIRFTNDVKIMNTSNGEGQGKLKFIKNYIESLHAVNNDNTSLVKGPSVRVYDCIINDFINYSNSYPDFIFYNSFVVDPRWEGTVSESSIIFSHCFVLWCKRFWIRGAGYTDVYSNYAIRADYMNFYDCIFNTHLEEAQRYVAYDLKGFPNTVTCNNCLSVNLDIMFNSIVSGDNNKTVGSMTEIFKRYTSDSSIWKETFELTDAAKEAYIGTDGTQIGMQGGNYPYTTTVQYPIVTKFRAEPQTNKAGMLNVEVEVDGK